MSANSWSEVAGLWSESWGEFAAPVWHAVLDATGTPSGAKVLDVGCGGGDFIAYGRKLGLLMAGADPAPGMLELARSKLEDATLDADSPQGITDEVRQAGAEDLPWPDETFDLATAFNSLQFADDTDDALAEMARVVVPGGLIAVANWAERALNDLNVVEQVLEGEAPGPDGDLRLAGGLEELLEDGGLTVVTSGLVEMPWEVPDDSALIRGILVGEDPTLGPDVVAAAAAYRNESGGYRLVNHFRFAVGRKPAGS